MLAWDAKASRGKDGGAGVCFVGKGAERQSVREVHVALQDDDDDDDDVVSSRQ